MPQRTPARRLLVALGFTVVQTAVIQIAVIQIILCPTTVVADNSAGWYLVRSGDTLTLIAERAGSSVADLRQANGLRGDLIHPEQRLVVPAPFSRSSGAAITWRRPYEGGGEVIRPFGDHRRGEVTVRRTGADVARPLGSPVLVPAHGVVRYVGRQDGYGTIAIIDHGAGYATVIGPLARDGLTVSANQVVLRGDMLGRVDEPPEGVRPYAHVELRRHQTAVDPARLLR